MEEMNENTIVQGFVGQPPKTDGSSTVADQLITSAKKSYQFRVPDETQIGAIFLYSFHLKKETYDRHFRSLSAKVLTLDHTFHSR
jgi:hypothetical protein